MAPDTFNGNTFIRTVELHRPNSDQFPESRIIRQGHRFTVGQQLSYDLTLNPIRQVYVSDNDISLNEIESGATILGKYHKTCPLGSVCVIKREPNPAQPPRWWDGFLLGHWVTIVDESNQPIVLSEIRVFGCKRDYGVPLRLDSWSSLRPGIPSLSFP